jgi:hypothetical protein
MNAIWSRYGRSGVAVEVQFGRRVGRAPSRLGCDACDGRWRGKEIRQPREQMENADSSAQAHNADRPHGNIEPRLARRFILALQISLRNLHRQTRD